MSVLVRSATRADIRQLAELITGHTPAESLGALMDAGAAYSAWHLAEIETGEAIGFQWIGPSEAGPSDICEIATFLAERRDRVAAGSKLFEATAQSARRLGYAWIDAEISTENDGARIYYQSHGFRLWQADEVRLTMRFDLD